MDSGEQGTAKRGATFAAVSVVLFNLLSVGGMGMVCTSPFFWSWELAAAGLVIFVIAMLPGYVAPDVFGSHFLFEMWSDDTNAIQIARSMCGDSGSDDVSWWNWSVGSGDGDGGDGGGGD